MTTAVPSTTLATIQPAFTDPERLALAGFLAGYRGLTREANALDLRQFTAWCRARSLALFAVRRADIEGFARELEARGRARATVTRRLCTIAGFFKVRCRRRTPRAFPGRPRPAAARGLRVARHRPGPQRAGRHAGGRRARPAGRPCADLATRAERPAGIGGHRRGHRAPGPGARAPDADHHPQGGKVVTIPLAPRTARAIDLATVDRCNGPVFLTLDGRRLDRHGAGRIVRKVARQAGITKKVSPHTLRHAFIASQRCPGTGKCRRSA